MAADLHNKLRALGHIHAIVVIHTQYICVCIPVFFTCF